MNPMIYQHWKTMQRERLRRQRRAQLRTEAETEINNTVVPKNQRKPKTGG